jgi:hypothetical protein
LYCFDDVFWIIECKPHFPDASLCRFSRRLKIGAVVNFAMMKTKPAQPSSALFSELKSDV